ncbi:Dehydrogenase FUM7 like protein [Verticillium longisporum]|uniref:Dehydrogenase FUM7 like protein n=1 Tax=Verticillium longisporum TaxID=100787 RepID=A0A8I2Z8H0_VERLO|nr:Dehydrogenase FUM7 like protein [Verticillium longisporum]
MATWFSSETSHPAFDIKSTPTVSYGLPFPEACAVHVNGNLSSHRVYIIASASLTRNTDALDRLKKALGDRVAGVHVGIGSHTPIQELVPIIAEAKDLGIDCLVTLGAGSITDGAKLIRFALANKVYSVADICSIRGERPHNWIQPSIPLICIPTTLSGGEYQAIAGATEEKKQQKMVFDPIRDPDLVIQDPELCTTTPERIWLSTGIRAVDHCVETLCSLLSNEEADTWAKRGLERLAGALLKCKQDPKDLEARHQCQTGVVEAMRAVSCGVPLGGSHAIGHQLGPLGVSHGETSCILLPAVCSFNSQEPINVEKQAVVTQILRESQIISEMLASEDVDQSKADLATILDIYLRNLGMPRTLDDVGFNPNKLDMLVSNSLTDHWITTNAIPITKESQVREILAKVTG